MIKNIKNIFQIASVIVFGSVFLYNCEPEADALGEQFFDGADGTEVQYDLIAYNINNNDTVRSDAQEIPLATLGAFSEGIFGMQKTAFVSQLRPSLFDPVFGDNAVVDSVVMVIKPLYASDSVTTSTDENYIHPDGNIAAKKIVNSYPVYKYGKTKINGNTNFNIRVHEVTDFLAASSDISYSNKTVNYGSEIGHKLFDGKVYSTSITKDADNSSIWSHEASLRIPMNPTFFQTKIIAKQGSADLKDAASFIRYFRGVRLSVDENDGYLFRFTPESAEIIMYYKSDKTENGTVTRPQSSFKFTMGAPNAHIGLYTYNRIDTPVATIPPASSSNTVTGDPKLYLQGMGGPSAGISIPASVIATLKDKFKNDKIGIMGAKIRMYTDEVAWNNKFQKPTSFVFLQKGATDFLPELASFAQLPQFSLVKAFDLDKNPGYYDFTVTQTLKEIIESEAPNKDFIIHAGEFRVDPNTGKYYGYRFDSRSYTPNRVVLVGTDPGNTKKIQLKVIYGTK